MDFIISASTDVGIRKDTNQDSLSIKVLNTVQGKMTFAVLCDGMGGLAKGELASATVVRAFMSWAAHELPALCEFPLDDHTVMTQWQDIIAVQNAKILNYGRREGVRLGTTVAAILLTATRYYIINVGDTRIYEIADRLVQITQDQTVVAREVSLGNITPEQAARDPRRNVLLQCVGASTVVIPEFFFGQTRKNAVYMLCSDGFRHEITPDEIFMHLHPHVLSDADTMKRNAEYLIELNKQRREQDNISVALVRSY